MMRAGRLRLPVTFARSSCILAIMALAPAWTVRIHVPLGARSRRRPFAELRAILATMRRFPQTGALGEYRHVEHFSLGFERFVAPGATATARVPVVTITTYMRGASLAEVEAFARTLADAHPWEHPVINCTGPDGSFVWFPDA